MHPAVCLCYIEANEPDALERSISTMTKYPWVTKVVVLHTDCDRLPRQLGKVEHVYQNYGSGFDRQPENGGFDEIDARNHALRLGRETGCDWLLVVDADEFFLPCTIDPIAHAHRSNKAAVCFECWHFITPTQYLFFENTMRPASKHTPAMHDPHIRAIRGSASIWFEQNPNRTFRDELANDTMHCTPTRMPTQAVLYAPGMFHIHTHHAYGEKRSAYVAAHDVMPFRDVKSGSNVFPKVYLDAYEPCAAAGKISIAGHQ